MIAEYNGQEIETGIVRFTAEWCVPCKSFAPIFDGVAAGADVPFYAIDVEQYGDLAQQQGVMSIPAAFSVEEGTWTRWTVTPSAEELAKEASRLDRLVSN